MRTLEDLLATKLSTMKTWKNVGKKSINDIVTLLARCNLVLPDEQGAKFKTTWQIHTMGGPIPRIFTSVEIAMRWAHKFFRDGQLVIEAEECDGGEMTYALRYKKDRTAFGSIGQRKHCPTCDHVVATRGDINGEWHPKSDDYLVPRDFEPGGWDRGIVDDGVA